MKKTQTFYLIGLLLLLSFKGMEPVSARETLHIVSYNILDGFDSQTDTCRRSRFVAWMRTQDPDIVALNELVGFTEKDLQALAASYGHPYVAIVKEEGYPVGLTSKTPITTVKKQVEGFWHGMLHARTAGLDVIVTHLSPFSWTFRVKEAQAITGYIRENKLTDCLVMGDCNAYAPYDADEVEKHVSLKKNMERWDREHPEYGNLHDGRFDYSALSQFLAAGFTDICREFVAPAERMSYPTAFSRGWKWNDPRLTDVGERLDFIWVSPALVPRCTGAAVHNGEDTDRLSDHYPVSVDLKRLP